VWILAQREGLSVQPLSPVFLHARSMDELTTLSLRFADELSRAQSEFMRLTGTDPEESIVLVLRFSTALPPSVLSRRSASRVSYWRNVIS
jgi:hypothetical protein